MSYRLLSFKSGAEARAGCSWRAGVRRGAGHGKAGWSSVLGALQDWPKANASSRRFESASLGKEQSEGPRRFRGLKLLAPVLYPGNIYCAGANITDHMARWARAQGKEPAHDEGIRTRALALRGRLRELGGGPGAKVKLPRTRRRSTGRSSWTAGFIGRTAKDVSVGKALACVAG